MESSPVLSEYREQVEFVCWFRRNYPDYKIFSIPNGAYTGKAQGQKLKNEGLLPGVHDLHIPELKLWIEMKEHAKKKPSKEQLEWGAYVESIGHSWFVGYGFEDAKEKTLTFLGPKYT